MTSRSKTETVVILALIGIFLVALLPALLHARQEYRDGIRRDEIAQRKIELEQYFNAHNAYPLEYDASPHQYVVVTQDDASATGWFVRAELENQHAEKAAFDKEAGRNYWYRYVKRSTSSNLWPLAKEGTGALKPRTESQVFTVVRSWLSGAGVNEDQQTYYEVCGGTYECQEQPKVQP